MSMIVQQSHRRERFRTIIAEIRAASVSRLNLHMHYKIISLAQLDNNNQGLVDEA